MTIDVRIRHRAGEFDLDVAFTTGGGITGLFGPSGAGKTLTLRCIAGLIRPAEGYIRLGERTLLDTAGGIDVPARARSVGFVFQQYALFPHLDVGQNVSFGMTSTDPAGRSEAVAALLHLVGLPGFQERRPRQLSGGQQQRVALARALATKPALLLLDEPFAAVDLKVRRRLRSELRAIHETTGTPILLVTHDLAEVEELSDSIITIDEGRVASGLLAL